MEVIKIYDCKVIDTISTLVLVLIKLIFLYGKEKHNNNNENTKCWKRNIEKNNKIFNASTVFAPYPSSSQNKAVLLKKKKKVPFLQLQMIIFTKDINLNSHNLSSSIS